VHWCCPVDSQSRDVHAGEIFFVNLRISFMGAWLSLNVAVLTCSDCTASAAVTRQVWLWIFVGGPFN